MKIGIVGAGGVGSACMMSLILRNCAREIVLIDLNTKRAKAVVTDMQYGATQSATVSLIAGDYPDLAGASLIMITAGVNEKAGGATDRNDPAGRLRLLGTNAAIYREIVSKIMKVAPQAVLLAITDPPEPLAQLAREVAGHEKVLSAGTFIDSLRFRWHLAQHFKVSPSSVDAYVVGEHGTSQVYLWSSAAIGGIPLKDLSSSLNPEQIENEVRFANITIIEGNQASQYGIGMIAARIAEIIVRDEHAVIPVGSYHPQYGTTLSLPSIVGKNGVVKVLPPHLSAQEKQGLQKSAETLKNAFAQIKKSTA